MSNVDVVVGDLKIELNYNTEKEKEAILECSAEINEEINRLLIANGRIDTKFLLFFILLKTQQELQEKSDLIGELNLTKLLSNIKRFIIKNNNFDSQILLGIISLKITLKKLPALDKSRFKTIEERMVNEKFDKLFEKLINKINSIENNIF